MTQRRVIRVLIVDGHDGVRLGLATALATVDDLLVVGEATSCAEALRLCARLQPDVALMETELPDCDGVSLIRRLRQTFPRLRVVVLTTLPTEELRQGVQSAGASGSLSKYVALDELIATIRAVHAEQAIQAQASREERD